MVSIKTVQSFIKSCGVKSILQTKAQSFERISLSELKVAPLKQDVVQFSTKIKCPTKEYNDIVQDMIMQRKSMINTVNKDVPVEVTLQGYKDNYIGANREIRNKIMNDLGDEDAVYSVNLLRTATSKLDNLIIQGHLPKDTILYRGATPYDFGLQDLNCKEFIEKFYKKDKLFTIPIYPETTLDKKIGESFAKGNILFKINAPKGTPGLYLEKLGQPKTGSYLNEEEILLPRNLVYKFKSYTQTDGYDVIELDIVSKKPFWKKIHEFWNEIKL